MFQIKILQIIFFVRNSFQKLNELSGNQQVERNIFIASRKTDINKIYMVYSAIGLCKCEILATGSRYPHHYVVGAHKFILSTNFSLVFSQCERQYIQQ